MKTIDYLLFRLSAKNEYNIHSPFLFDLYNTVFKSKKRLPFFNILSDIKHLFCTKKRNKFLPFQTSLPKRYEEIISQLSRKFHHTSILYISVKEDSSPIYTLYCKGKDLFTRVVETSDVSSVLEIIPTLEIIFFDKKCEIQNHLLIKNDVFTHTSEKSILVFEFPHSSQKSLLYFKQISVSEKITLSLDLYFIGILFFNTSLSKQFFHLKI